MGPRPFSRGRDSIRIAFHHTSEASMGPRPFSRGRSLRWSIVRTSRRRLQWGLDLSVEEGPLWRICFSPIPTLQWGLDLSVEEGTRAVGCRIPVCAGFNGASTFQSRKVDDATIAATKAWNASMGPRPFSRGRFAN